jgi:hypothetical protein
MPRRPSLSCRQFRQLHAEYVDGFLCVERSQAMRSHGDDCPACAALDVQVRRSLLALQTLPTIAPSADFRERLHKRLVLSQLTERAPTRARMRARMRVRMRVRRRVSMREIRWGLASVVTAASVAFLVLAAPSKLTRPVELRPALVHAPEPAAPMAPKPTELPESARTAPITFAARPAETLRFEALPGVTAVRRSPSMLASPSVRLQLASLTGQ